MCFQKKIIEKMIEIQKSWLSAQRMEQFVEVNLGTWAGTNTRKMAEQSDCKDFYNRVYQPFSDCVHSSWAHIGQFNARICGNPGHRSHWLPTVVEFAPDPNWLYLAAQKLDKTFVEFDTRMGIEVDAENTLEFVINSLNEIYGN